MAKAKARFIEPMLLLRTEKLPQGANWLYEIKLDSYRRLFRIKDALSVIRASGVQQVIPVALAHSGWIALQFRRELGERIPKLISIAPV